MCPSMKIQIVLVFITIITAIEINGSYLDRLYQHNNFILNSDKTCVGNDNLRGIPELKKLINFISKEAHIIKNVTVRLGCKKELITLNSRLCTVTLEELIKDIHNDASDLQTRVDSYEKCKFCTSKDQYGHDWTACQGETESMDCPPNSPAKSMKWHCGEDLQFTTKTPDYSQCYTTKIEELKNQLSFNGNFIIAEKQKPLEPEVAERILDDLYSVVSGRNDSMTIHRSISYFGHEIELISDLAKDTILNTNVNTSEEKMEELTKKSMNVILKVLKNEKQWKQLERNGTPKAATNVLNNLESSAFFLANRNEFYDNSTEGIQDKIYTLNSTEDIAILLVFGSKYLEGNKAIVFSDEKIGHETKITVNIPMNTANRFMNNSSMQGVKFFGMITSPDLIDDKLQAGSSSNDTEDEVQRINGKMISFSLNDDAHTLFYDERVVALFSHEIPTLGLRRQVFRRKLHPGETRRATSVCAFWDTEKLKWSTEGCRKIESQSSEFFTTCACNHLTAFALLMGYHEYAEKDERLQLLTWILSPVSIFCLFLTIVVLTMVKSIRSEQSKITIHLCLTLILGNLILIGTDKNNYHIDHYTCYTLGVLSHYIWLCAFLWMAVEGFHLYHKIIKVFDSAKNNLPKYAAVAYLIPLFIVITTVALGFSFEKDSIYVGEMYCWINEKYIWSFKIPVLLVSTGNTIILIRVLRIARQKQSNTSGSHFPKDGQRSANRKLVVGTVSLSMLLGVTWIVGFFSMVNSPGHDYLPYVFTVLNGSQGIFMFIFHCCLNETIYCHVSKTVRERLASLSWASAYSKSQTRNTSLQLEINMDKNANSNSK